VKILVTGGAGFIGSGFIYYLLARHAADEVVHLDARKYAGNIETLADITDDPRYECGHGDNPSWWQRVKSGGHRTCYQTMCGERLRGAQPQRPAS
jgi:dTDP-D-glucose 4,6-dehydratase